MPNVKLVKIGNNTYEIEAKYIQDGNGNAKTWADILNLISEKGTIYVLDELPAANATSYETYKHSLVFVPDSTAVSGTFAEYVILRSGTEGSYTYAWEKVGTTQIDLANYLKKGVEYAAAAKSAGAHTHTVTITTVSVDATKKLGATASGTALSTDSETFAKTVGLTGTTTFAVAPTVDNNGTLEFTTASVGVEVATSGSALTSASVSAQPTITITEDANNSGPVNEHVTTSTATATTSSDGAHTHDVEVASA